MQDSLVSYALSRVRDGSVFDYLNWRVRYRGIHDLFTVLLRRAWPESVPAGLAEVARLYYLARPHPDFKIIQIETIAGCNYSCSFCPIGKIDMPMGRMKRELYDKIIGDLKNFRGSIHLFLRNEPLLDKRIVELTRLAKERTQANVVLFTNGALLTEPLARELTKYATVVINDYGGQVTPVVRSWGSIKNLVLIPRKTNEVLENRAGNLPDRAQITLEAFCIRPFEQMYVAFDGRAVLCCQDWKLETCLGNATSQSLQEIWHGAAYQAVRRKLFQRKRTGLCAKCDFAGA